jgi:hypothetical protein
MLSAIAAPVAWFADIASGVASIFGWSSPLDLSEVTRAVQTIVPYANNCDMPDQSMPLSLFGRNRLEILPGVGGTDIDETSIDFIKTIPAFAKTFNISTSDVAQANVATLDVQYTNYLTITDSPRTVFNHVPVSYLAQMFSYARGGLIYRFKFVSTEFHSGRYAIFFTPRELDCGATTVSTAQSYYCHREIVDLRDGCEFTFHVPYTSIANYRRIGTTNEPFGVLTVQCINPLIAPASVSSVVNVLVEICGAPDVEFAFPRPNTLSVYSPSAPQSNVSFIQSENEITSGTVGNSRLNDDNCINARHCQGEKVMSLLSMLKHNNQILPITQGTTAASAVISPFAIYTAAKIIATNSDSPYRSDLYSYITSCFAMSRGAVRYRVFNNSPTSTNSQEFTRASIGFKTSGTSAGIVESITPIANDRWGLLVIQNSVFRGAVEVQTPPYHHTYTRLNVDEFVGSLTLLKDYAAPTANNMVLNVNTATANGNQYYRQVADDFQLSGFVSCPSLVSQ